MGKTQKVYEVYETLDGQVTWNEAGYHGTIIGVNAKSIKQALFLAAHHSWVDYPAACGILWRYERGKGWRHWNSPNVTDKPGPRQNSSFTQVLRAYGEQIRKPYKHKTSKEN